MRFISRYLFLLTILCAGYTSAVSQTSVGPSSVVLTSKDVAAYRIFFRRITTYQQMMSDAAANGQDKSYLARSLKSRLSLGDTDMMNLEIVAQDCETQLAPLQVQMKAALAQFWARFPGNKIPPGVKPVPSPLVSQIQAAEDAVVTVHRLKFSQTVKTEVFQNADVAIRSTYGNPGANPSGLIPSGGGN